MKLFEHYAALIHRARDIYQLQFVVREACRIVSQAPITIESLANPGPAAVEIRKNLALLQQLLELADEKLKEFEGE